MFPLGTFLSTGRPTLLLDNKFPLFFLLNPQLCPIFLPYDQTSLQWSLHRSQWSPWIKSTLPFFNKRQNEYFFSLTVNTPPFSCGIIPLPLSVPGKADPTLEVFNIVQAYVNAFCLSPQCRIPEKGAVREESAWSRGASFNLFLKHLGQVVKHPLLTYLP